MFFSKRTEPIAAPTERESLEWEQRNRRSQSFRIITKSWFFKVQPGLQYRDGRKIEFTFEGHVRLGTTRNVPVYGEIEVWDDAEPPRFLIDRWKTLPESVEGHASLSASGDPSLPPQLNITFYCTADAFELVTRVIIAGFSATGGKAAFDVDIGYPDEKGEDFWKERWQSETLQVLKWDARSTAEQQ